MGQWDIPWDVQLSLIQILPLFIPFHDSVKVLSQWTLRVKIECTHEVHGTLTQVLYICDRLQENRAQRSTLRKKFFLLHLQSCRRPDIELSKFYHRSLSRSNCNRPNRSLPSAWNNTFLRNRSIFSRYLRTPRCARFSCRRSHIYILYIFFFFKLVTVII